MDVLIGIDLGGTNVRVGALDLDGRVLARAETPIQAARGPREGLNRIQGLIDRVLADALPANLLGIGIGASGPIDRERGAIQNPYTLPTWVDVDICTPLSEKYQVPVTLENDADAAALGEYWKGAGQGAERLALVTVGTGIGTAFVYHGELYRGMKGVHPEFGHHLIDPDGPVCYCGARGCWESLASGSAIGHFGRLATVRAMGERIPPVPGGLLERSGHNPEIITGLDVAAAAAAGDPLAIEVYRRAGQSLARGLVNLIHFWVPDVLLLGGGVMEDYHWFEPIIHDTVAAHGLMVPVDAVVIRKTGLGAQAGMIGAGYSIKQRLRR